MSAISGNGYSSACSTGFTVILKSPQILTAPDCFGTGTTGVAHSEWLTLDRIPSDSSLSISASTFGLNAYGTCLGRQNFGVASSAIFSFAFTPFSYENVFQPGIGWKTFSYLVRSLLIVSAGGGFSDDIADTSTI